MAGEIRQTVTIDGRTLHLRRSGSGPAVALLHESPRSSAVLAPLAARLARDFTVFALDSPGFGQSDPLPIPRPTIQDFADAIVASLRAMGVTRAPVYGTHTGACIAVSIAKRYPDFATGAVLDGYPVFTPEEADAYAYLYLKLFEPDWEGQHVARLWSRVRDQYTFFPWYALGRGSRIERDPPSPELQTAVVRDFLAAGSNYARGYEAAFRMDALRELEGVSVPVTLMCREDDLLFGHLDRLPPLPETMEIVRLGPDRAVLADRVASIFARSPGAVPEGPRLTAEGAPNGVLRPLAPGLLAHCYGAGTGSGDPLVLLPDLPGGLHDWDLLARRLSTQRRVIVIHWPGGGVSPPLEGAAGQDPAAVLEAIAAALAGHGITRFDLGGRGAGALAALDLAARPGTSVGRVILMDPPALDQGEAPQDPLPRPEWHGGHLFAAWSEARDRMLYRPWHRRRHAAARRFGPGVDVHAVHATFRARVLANGADMVLAGRLLAAAAGLPKRDLSRCTAILREGDPDVVPLSAALSGAGASVQVAHYDDLFDTAALALARAG
jgi:pimeloyl-ACP methyl ester carboxylesterase